MEKIFDHDGDVITRHQSCNLDLVLRNGLQIRGTLILQCSFQLLDVHLRHAAEVLQALPELLESAHAVLRGEVFVGLAAQLV